MGKIEMSKKTGKDFDEEGAIVAAITTALYEISEEAHDTENAVLTIRTVSRKSLDWRSKIHAMRAFLKL